MISESFVYWFTRLDHLHSFCDGLGFLFSVVALVSLVLSVIGYIGKSCAFVDEGTSSRGTSYEKERVVLTSLFRTARKLLVGSFIACTVLNCFLAFLPTTKEMAAIYVVPKIANNESIKEVGSEIIDLAKDWLKELHPKNVSKDAKDIAACVVTNAVNAVMTNVANTAKSEVNKATTF